MFGTRGVLNIYRVPKARGVSPGLKIYLKKEDY